MSYHEDYLKDTVKDPFDNLRQPFLRFLRIESSGGILLIFATIAALIVANSAWGSEYEMFWKKEFTIGADFFHLSKPIILWINDGLMAIFFFLVGLEIKRELLAGELSTPKKAALPIIAALGGMIVPAGFFLFFNRNGQGLEGWGIPMATDIAFSLGILSLLGKRVPIALKVFLVAFAIVDDIGAVLVIAFFYSANIHWNLLLIAMILLVVLFIFNARNIRYIPFYMIIGWVIWYLFLKAGIHPTIAGVLIAFSIPSTRKIKLKDFNFRMNRNLTDFCDEPCEDSITLNHQQLASIDNMQSQLDKVQSPLQSLEHSLHGFVTYLVMPLFAFANAGVVLKGAGLESFNSLTLSIGASLVLGKITGILLFSYLTVKFGISALPNNIDWRHILGAGMLGGIGFTMSLFISNLAYDNIILLNQAKLGILLGSFVAAIVGFVYLKKVLSEKT
ncbi:MAG: Na+/H+ antiporter NhaA [Bacteroidales bacterium]|nr:Na+/H+ antiporter NhaA [Bacteroidales bacterium]